MDINKKSSKKFTDFTAKFAEIMQIRLPLILIYFRFTSVEKIFKTFYCQQKTYCL